jgi:hypothetical protein
MKTLPLSFSILFVSLVFFSIGQEPPIAHDDYAEARVHETIAIRVLDNDSSFNNNPIRIFSVFGSAQGQGAFTFNDSLVFYTPKTFTLGVDVLRYMVLDIETNLFSELAKIFIEVTNNGIAFLDKNQVNCKIKAGAMQFFDGFSYYGYEVPAGEGTHSFFAKNFYLGGIDDDGELHLAGENYQIFGADFYPGPVSDSIYYTQDYDIHWHKVWKLDKEEIDNHRANWQQPGYEPIENIRDWPGNGNPMLGQASLLAPFYDWDNDGIYDPMKGDFPLIKGDQTIFNLYNDDRVHTESGGKKLGIEIQAKYYVYDQPEDSALSQTVFGSKSIINRSQKDYHDVYAAFFVDFDIGFAMDDFIGCDTVLHSAFAFNGLPADGSGQPYAYGAHPPAQSFTCLNFNMDSFIYYHSYHINPSPQDRTPPRHAVEYYNYMKSIWRDGTPLTYGGTGYGGDEPVSYAFPGDPVTNEGWTEESAGILYGDRKGLVTKGPTTLLSGDTLTLDFALVFARDYEGDHLSSVALLKERIGQVRDFYQEALSVEEIKLETPVVRAFPNPFVDQLFIQTNLEGETINWTVVDVLGKVVGKGKADNQSQIEIKLQHLEKGIYFLLLNDGRSQAKEIIIKTN